MLGEGRGGGCWGGGGGGGGGDHFVALFGCEWTSVGAGGGGVGGGEDINGF